MKKKGFTLVELLAVIAILAILVIIALPNVLRMFRNAKENTFVTEVQEIIKTAEQGYISGSLSNKECKCFSSASNPLDLSGRNNIQYYVEFNDKGQVINLTVKDDTYQFVSEGEVIKIADIGSSTSGKAKTTSLALDSTEVPSCDGSSGSTGSNKFDIKYTSMLKSNPFSGGKDEIESIKFVNTISEEIRSMYQQQQQEVVMAVSSEILGVEDVSDDNSENIMMWWTDTDGNGKYEVTIGGEGGVRANTNSSGLFENLMNLTSIDLTYLETSQVTDMCAMFFGCSNLTTLDLNSFDTSNVTDMSDMFWGCSSLTELDLSHFKLNDSANDGKGVEVECMFYNTPLLTEEKEPYIKFNKKYADIVDGWNCAPVD